MKALIAITMTTFIATFSSAAPNIIKCKKSTEASAQGFEALISGNSATLSFKGQKVADLTLDQAMASAGGDQKAVSKFSQHVTNGFGLTVATGGLAGMTEATVLHDGIAGFTPQANLDDCRR